MRVSSVGCEVLACCGEFGGVCEMCLGYGEKMMREDGRGGLWYEGRKKKGMGVAAVERVAGVVCGMRG